MLIHAVVPERLFHRPEFQVEGYTGEVRGIGSSRSMRLPNLLPTNFLAKLDHLMGYKCVGLSPFADELVLLIGARDLRGRRSHQSLASA